MRAAVAALVVSLTMLAAAAGDTGAPVYKVTLRDGGPEGDELVEAAGGPVLPVPHGESFRLRVSTDAARVVHLHGYDIEALAGPDAPAEFAIDGRAMGRFAVVDHGPPEGPHRDDTLFYLEVRP